MFEKLKSKKVFLAVIILLLIVIPVTLLQLGQRQEQRSGASGEAVSILLNPLTKNVAVGEQFLVPVSVNAGQNDISAVDITFTYDADLLGEGAFTPSPTFTKVILTTTPEGTIHYIGVNPSSNVLTGSSVSIGTLSFKGKNPGTATVGFSKIHVNASQVASALPVNTNDTKPGTYVVGSGSTTSPTPIQAKHIFDFNDDSKIDEVDLNLLYSTFKSREGD